MMTTHPRYESFDYEAEARRAAERLAAEKREERFLHAVGVGVCLLIAFVAVSVLHILLPLGEPAETLIGAGAGSLAFLAGIEWGTTTAARRRGEKR